MKLSEKLNQNRALMNIADVEQLRLAQIPPAQMANVLTKAIALIDSVQYLTRNSLDVELCAVKGQADDAEAAIAEAVLAAK